MFIFPSGSRCLHFPGAVSVILGLKMPSERKKSRACGGSAFFSAPAQIRDISGGRPFFYYPRMLECFSLGPPPPLPRVQRRTPAQWQLPPSHTLRFGRARQSKKTLRLETPSVFYRARDALPSWLEMPRWPPAPHAMPCLDIAEVGEVEDAVDHCSTSGSKLVFAYFIHGLLVHAPGCEPHYITKTFRSAKQRGIPNCLSTVGSFKTCWRIV